MKSTEKNRNRKRNKMRYTIQKIGRDISQQAFDGVGVGLAYLSVSKPVVYIFRYGLQWVNSAQTVKNHMA